MPPSGSDILELSIPSSYDAMEQVAGLVEQAGQMVGISEDDEVDLMISVMEAVNNAIQHGNREDAGKHVHIRVEASGNSVTFWVRDEGGGFAPSSVPNPLDSRNLLNPSGRGLLMMREFMDKVEIASDTSGTSVKMVKRFSGMGSRI